MLQNIIANIQGLDEAAMAAARARQNTLTKPPGSLGRLEELSVQLAGITGKEIPIIKDKVIITMAGDHGVVAEGVSAFPQEVTPQMVLGFVGGMAGINALSRLAGAKVVVVDMGVATDLGTLAKEGKIVDKKVADPFAKILAAKAAALPAGNPAEKNVVLGSLVSTEAADRVQSLIQDAVSKGAQVLSGNSRDGTIMTATVLDRVTPKMAIYTEESFGPVVCIIRVDNEEEAINVANDGEYGLSSSVFSQDIARALNVAKRVEAGICHINGPTVHDEAQMPFGGVKASGYGRFGGKAGIAEFTDLRWISIETGPQRYPF